MSKINTWMPLYVGDYLADTGHLSTLEHGAYMLLIIHYWRTGPLPDDDDEMAQIARVSDEEWERMGKRIRRFFSAQKGKLHQKRIDVEIQRAENVSKKRAESGRVGAKARQKNAELNQGAASKCSANAQQTDKQNARQIQIQVQREESKEDSCSKPPAMPKPPAAPIGADFERWWKAYPRRVGMGRAEVAYARARKLTTAEILLAALERNWSADTRYIPHPATWLNEKRWLDEADDHDPVLKAAGLDRNGKLPANPQLRLVRDDDDD